MRLLAEDFAENARHVAPFDPQRVQSWIEAATREHDATIGVIEANAGLAGLIYLVPESWWWSSPDQWYIAEKLTFVSPRHRGAGRHVAELVKFARWFVDTMSARLGYPVYLIGSVVATKDARAKTLLFSRLLNFGGGIYIYPDPTPPSLNQ